MAEATIALPVFILLLIGATFFRSLFIAQSETRLTARRCAWAHALGGCERAPEGCAPSNGSAHDGRVPNIEEKVKLQVGNGDNPLREVPVVRDALAGLFGSSTTAIATSAVPYPLDEDRAGVATADATVVCNSIATEVLDIAKDLLCDHLGC